MLKPLEDKPKRILVDVTGKPFSGETLKMLRARKPYYSMFDDERPISKAMVAKVIGCCDHQILRWERAGQRKDYENRSPRAISLKKLSLYFQVDPCEFLGLEWMFADQAERYDAEVIKGISAEDFCDTCGKYIGDIKTLMDIRGLK